MNDPKDEYCDDYNEDDQSYWADIDAQMEFDQTMDDNNEEGE